MTIEIRDCICGRKFKKNGRRRFCSDACKQRAYRNRKCYDTSNISRPIMRYFGGKWRLSSWIISHFPSHTTYVEPFVGAASVFLNKDPSPIEVLNDKNDRVVNLLRVLANKDSSLILKEKLFHTLYSKTEYYNSREISVDPIEDAKRMLVLGHQGHGSTATSGGKKSGWRRGIRTPENHSAKEWQEFHRLVPSWSTRLRRAYIENEDAIKVIKRWDSPKTLFYVDPPYLQSTRQTKSGYAHEVDDKYHKRLARVLNSVSGAVVLSGYDSDLYGVLYRSWKVVHRNAVKDHGHRSIESLWLSPT